MPTVQEKKFFDIAFAKDFLFKLIQKIFLVYLVPPLLLFISINTAFIIGGESP